TSEQALPDVEKMRQFDIVLFNKDHSHKSMHQIVELVNTPTPATPLIVLVRQYQRNEALELMQQGATDVVAINEIEHLVDCIIISQEQRGIEQLSSQARMQESECQHRWETLMQSVDAPVAYISHGIITRCNNAFNYLIGMDNTEGSSLLDHLDKESINKIKPIIRSYSEKTLNRPIFIDIGFTPNKKQHKHLNNFPTESIKAQLNSCLLDGENALQIVLHNPRKSHQAPELKKPHVAHTNIEHFHEELQGAINLAQETSLAGYVGLIEIDDFQDVKDALGISVSDLILDQISTFISESLSNSINLSRLGNGAFVVLINSAGDQNAFTLMEKLRLSLAQHEIRTDSQGIRLTCSIGLVEISDKTHSVDELIAHADTACRAARRQGGNHTHLFDPYKDYDLVQDTDHEWKTIIEDALSKNRFRLLLQPIVSLKKQQLHNQYEVFIRMLDEHDNEILPSQFLHAAQQAGIEHLIDKWVILNSLQMLGEHLNHEDTIQLYIKLSSGSVMDNTFPVWLQSILETINKGKHKLVFEFNADMCKQHMARLRVLLPELKKINQEICIEHFGKDKNHFHLLDELHFDYLKIDGSLVTHIAHDRRNQLAIKKIVESCNKLNIKVIAVSVQDATGVSYLWQTGVTQIQGYYVQPPQIGLEYNFSASI
ncbi:MAG: EAL domain-containing protein, partial [Gammaproteobacteria bacterium]|nr:EAL domain-containing protein [Gammaproteobacteria bacterium]